MQPRPIWGLTYVTNVINVAQGIVELVPAPPGDNRIVLCSVELTAEDNSNPYKVRQIARAPGPIDTVQRQWNLFFGFSFIVSEVQYTLGGGQSLCFDVSNSNLYINLSYWVWNPGLQGQYGFQG